MITDEGLVKLIQEIAEGKIDDINEIARRIKG